ncbi:AzlC family ABC transporter permease [Haladaptatus paucihalophilus]|nr:AzlC family ABC transporter permease [Haladaptatus paucihalophilus]SHL11621.1 4-azaleucine resistance probable transporter AzlC [Haladaptatus paucihalophilus DX253]
MRGDKAPAWRAFFVGARTISPFLVGIVPFALVTGATAVRVGMTPSQAVGMSLFMFAGTAQLAAIELMKQAAPMGVVVLTAIVVNVRLVIYSISAGTYFDGENVPRKLLAAYLLTDESYAVTFTRFREETPQVGQRIWFYIGAAGAQWITWQAGTLTGAVFGANIPEIISLDFIIPLTFLALLMPLLTDRAFRVTAIVAAVVSILGANIPFNLGFIVAVIGGISAGVIISSRTKSSSSRLGLTKDRDADTPNGER